MKTVTSISGGKTSAYLAANYPTDYNVFALVRVEDEKCRFPDEKIRRYVEDRIQAPFIGTAEDDLIIYTILDLEQYLGRKIDWVTGDTFEEVIRKRKALPNIATRFCTTEMKMKPICYWWLTNIGEPVKMNIGYRANEVDRANSLNEQVNEAGLTPFALPVTMKQIKSGKWYNKNETFYWRQPHFPLITNNVYRYDIINYWENKPVRFASYNNCVGCFHRNELFLAKMFYEQRIKMQWFADQEVKNRWKKEIRYEQLKNSRVAKEIGFDDMPGCWSGFCEVA